MEEKNKVSNKNELDDEDFEISLWDCKDDEQKNWF